MKNGDVWAGGVLAALGVFIVMQAWEWDYLAADGPGPGFFPVWYGALMIALSLVLVLQSVRGAQAADGAARWSGVGRALVAWLAFTASIVLLKPLGFMLAFALLVVFIVRAMYGQPWRVAVAVAVAGAVGFYLVFPLGLGLELPVNALGF